MHKLRAIAVGIALGAMAFPALAQETTVIGRGGKPSVTVDLSVLDELSPTQKPPARATTQPGTRAPSKLNAPRASNGAKSKNAAKKPQTKSAAKASDTLAQPHAAAVAPAPPPPVAAAPMPMPMPPPTVTEAQPAAPPPLTSLPPSPSAPPAAPALPPALPMSQAPQAPMPAPVASAPPQQVAALPPISAASLGPGRTMQLAFGESASQLDDRAKRDLDVLVRTIGTDEETRLQLTAYASAPGADNASQARRLSLSRALAVRTYLIEKGVKSTRIDVRALGNKNEGGPADRVDVLVARR